MTTIAAGVCVFAVCNARAQSATTNAVTFTATTYQQGNITTNSSGTEKIYVTTKQVHNTAALLGQISAGILGTNGVGFSKAAKLVLIVSHGTNNNNNVPTFAVIDGTNFYDLSSNTNGGYNIMNMGSGDDQTTSGTEGINSPEKKTTQVQLLYVNFNNTGTGTAGNLPLSGDGSLFFNITGLGTINQSDTATNSAGIYTETLKASITGMTGQGGGGDQGFVVSAMMSVSGKGLLSQR